MTPEQHKHIDSIIDRFSQSLRSKYAAGQREHGGNMWTKPGMLRHAQEEVMDLVSYLWTLSDQLAERASEVSLPPLCYVAGPFRGRDSWEMEQNIRRAEALALEVWRIGVAAICPHTNTRFYQGAADDDVWLKGDLAILARCDVLLLTPDWQDSTGATAERDFAIGRGMPVVATVSELAAWKHLRG